jgi:hypothetical protein
MIGASILAVFEFRSSRSFWSEIRPLSGHCDARTPARNSVCPTTGVQLQGPEGAQRLRALPAATSELGSAGAFALYGASPSFVNAASSTTTRTYSLSISAARPASPSMREDRMRTR